MMRPEIALPDGWRIVEHDDTADFIDLRKGPQRDLTGRYLIKWLGQDLLVEASTWPEGDWAFGLWRYRSGKLIQVDGDPGTLDDADRDFLTAACKSVFELEDQHDADRRELAERFATQDKTREGAIDEIVDLL